jgi:NAD-dependent deacetylase
VTVLTGAGVSAESGLATFRDAQDALWANFRPEELATPDAFRRNPKLVWDWYAWRRERVGGVQPNPGHFALADIERRTPEFLLITQNVDGLHQRAGSRRMVELHGNIGRVKCFTCECPAENWEAGEAPPRCRHCGGLLRPDVVWFGERLPQDEWCKAEEAVQRSDVFLSVGTSSSVWPAAGLESEARVCGAMTIEVNPNPTELTGKFEFSLRGLSGVILPALVAAAWPETSHKC